MIKNKLIVKVSSKSEPKEVAGMIANLAKEEKTIEIQTIGAGAVNQAIKSIIIARGYIAPSGFNLTCIPTFVNVEVDGETRTGIKFIVLVDY